MDFSWGNANLFKPELVVKIQLQPSLSALQTWEGAPTETTLPRQYLHKQLGFRLEGKGTQPPLLGQSRDLCEVLPRSDPQVEHGAIWGAGSNTSASASRPAPSSCHSSYQKGAFGKALRFENLQLKNSAEFPTTA